MEGNGTSIAILIGVWATFALDVFSTLNSSPQTTELFAEDRQDTLWHWVVIGSSVAVGGGVLAWAVSGKVWPAIATALVALGMMATYKHALARGQGQGPPANASGY